MAALHLDVDLTCQAESYGVWPRPDPALRGADEEPVLPPAVGARGAKYVTEKAADR